MIISIWRNKFRKSVVLCSKWLEFSLIANINIVEIVYSIHHFIGIKVEISRSTILDPLVYTALRSSYLRTALSHSNWLHWRIVWKNCLLHGNFIFLIKVTRWKICIVWHICHDLNLLELPHVLKLCPAKSPLAKFQIILNLICRFNSS